ncbi:MAG: cytochrome b/b6 domain-containing protein [Acidobacteriota bacterium]
MQRLSFIAIISFLCCTGLAAQSNETCLGCHSDKTMTMERNGKSVSLYAKPEALKHSPHAKMSCVTCHAGFNPDNIPHKAKIEPVQCQSCHKQAPAKHAFHKTVVAEGADKAELCKDCHGTHDVTSPKDPASKFHPSHVAEACAQCHGGEKDVFDASAHGLALKAQTPNAPNCVKCHSTLMPTAAWADAKPAEQKLAQEKLCLSCHGKTGAENGVTPQFIMGFDQSVHAEALRKGDANAPTCGDCHGSHEVKKAGDPDSPVNKKNIQTACAKCHATEAGSFAGSIHGTALAKGNTSAPGCTDCHGEHKILAANDPASPVSKLRVSADVCMPCHNQVKISEKYGIATERSETYMDSFHGLAVKAGKAEAANCASCHGSHDILPAKDPHSRINKKNLPATCGQCHPGANEKFTEGTVHVSRSKPSDSGLVYFISNLYITLIVVTIGGMAVHNILDFLRKSRRRLKHRRHGPLHDDEIGHALYLRMTVSERLQHGALALSFITLVLTGFMLHYPDAWWVVPLRTLSPTVFEIRSILHRTAAVIMVLTSLYHVYYVLFVPRGKQLIRDLMPKIQDAYDAIGVAKYNLGLSDEKPLLDRFSYIEKAEYWALIWGTIVMSVTGVILWADNTFLGLFGKEFWDVARTMHYYEAWLAALAILVWHFYFIIFNPDIYPMNLAWIRGTISEEEMYDEHPLELERIKEEERRQQEEAERRQSAEPDEESNKS